MFLKKSGELNDLDTKLTTEQQVQHLPYYINLVKTKYIYFPSLKTVRTPNTEGLTCVPNILHPHIGTGSEEQPLHWDEEEANDVRGKRHTNKEY